MRCAQLGTSVAAAFDVFDLLEAFVLGEALLGFDERPPEFELEAPPPPNGREPPDILERALAPPCTPLAASRTPAAAVPAAATPKPVAPSNVPAAAPAPN